MQIQYKNQDIKNYKLAAIILSLILTVCYNKYNIKQKDQFLIIAYMDQTNKTIFQIIKNYYKQTEFSSTKKQEKHQIIELYKPFLQKMIKIRQVMNLSFSTFITAVQLIQRKPVIYSLKYQFQILSRQGQSLTHKMNNKTINSSQLFYQFQQNITNNQNFQQKNHNEQRQEKSQSNTSFSQSQNSLGNSYLNNKHKQEWKSSIAILYIAHKVVQDLYKKYTVDVWIQRLNIQFLSYEQVLNQQARILQMIDFHVLVPTESTFQLLQFLLTYLNIYNKKQLMFCQYILQLSVSHKQTDLLSFDIKKRVQIILSAIRLTCHFLKPYDWNPIILTAIQVTQQRVNKRCSKLLKLILEKQKNKDVHQKYQSKQYEQISKIRLIKIRDICQNTPQTQIQSTIYQNHGIP